MTISSNLRRSETFDVIASGTYKAICHSVVDVGVSEYPTFGELHVIYFGFEIPTERVRYVRGGLLLDSPLSVWKCYESDLSEGTSLREHLQKWSGIPTKEFGEAMRRDQFDIFDLIGTPCELTILHTPFEEPTFPFLPITDINPSATPTNQEMISVKISPENERQFDELPAEMKDIYLALDPEYKPPIGTPVPFF